MSGKTVKINTRIEQSVADRLKATLDRLGISESEYIRGALAAKLRRDNRKNG